MKYLLCLLLAVFQSVKLVDAQSSKSVYGIDYFNWYCDEFFTSRNDILLVFNSKLLYIGCQIPDLEFNPAWPLKLQWCRSTPRMFLVLFNNVHPSSELLPDIKNWKFGWFWIWTVNVIQNQILWCNCPHISSYYFTYGRANLSVGSGGRLLPK